jgi:hypothetical protein
VFRGDRGSQSLALRQQVLNLQGQLEKRPRLSRIDKLVPPLLCVRTEQRQVLDIPIIARPARKAPLRLLGNLQRVKVVLQKGWNRLTCKVAWGAEEEPYNIYPSLWHLGVGITAVAPFASEAHNLQWQTRLPSWSIAGPLIVGDRVFVTSEPNDLIYLNKADGRTLWVRSNNFHDALTDQEKLANPALAEVEVPAARLREINASFAGGWPEAPALAEKAKLCCLGQ